MSTKAESKHYAGGIAVEYRKNNEKWDITVSFSKCGGRRKEFTIVSEKTKLLVDTFIKRMVQVMYSRSYDEMGGDCDFLHAEEMFDIMDDIIKLRARIKSSTQIKSSTTIAQFVQNVKEYHALLTKGEWESVERKRVAFAELIGEFLFPRGVASSDEESSCIHITNDGIHYKVQYYTLLADAISIFVTEHKLTTEVENVGGDSDCDLLDHEEAISQMDDPADNLMHARLLVARMDHVMSMLSR
jgi:hypothetical protein